MPILKRREDLNQELLKQFYKKRGFGTITPDFYKTCNDVFDGKVKDRVVFQCKCGQVMIIHEEVAERAIKKFGEEIPCKDCGLASEMSNSLKIDFVKIENLKKIELMIQNLDDLSETSVQSKMDEINSIDPTLINATHPQELFYQIFLLDNQLKSLAGSGSPIIKIVGELFEKAMGHNVEFIKIFQYSMVSRAEMRNTTLTELHTEQFRLYREKLKFYGLFDETEIDQSVGQKELELNAKLNTYSHLVEEKKLLETILNLVKIADGKSYELEPFKNETVVINGKSKKVKNLSEMILAFNNYVSGHPIYILLSDLYKTRLRNAHAHNDYELLMDRQQIQYKDSLSINEFFRINNEIIELHLATKLGLNEAFYNLYPVVRHIKLGYDEPLVEQGYLVPANAETLPEIHVEGYAFNGKNIFDPILSLKDSKLFIKTPVSIDFYDISSYPIKVWLKQILIVNGQTIVSFHNIISLNPEHKIGEQIIPDFEPNVFEKRIVLSKDLLIEIENYIKK